MKFHTVDDVVYVGCGESSNRINPINQAMGLTNVVIYDNIAYRLCGDLDDSQDTPYLLDQGGP